MAEAKKSNSFAIWVTVVAVLVIGAIIAAVMLMNSALKGEVTPLNNGAEAKGTQTVQVYADFLCPHCKEFEEVFAEDIKQINEGDVAKIEYVLVAIMDRNTIDAYSTRSANAAYCVADENPAGVDAFVAAVFGQQPVTTADPIPTNEDLIKLAADNGAPNAADCINNLTHEDVVKKNTRAMPADPTTGNRGTPTVTLNGEYLPISEFQAKLPEFKGE